MYRPLHIICTALFLMLLTTATAQVVQGTPHINDSIATINQRIKNAEASGTKTILVDALMKKTRLLLRHGMLDDALITANQALLLSNEIKSEKISEQVYNLLSVCYIKKNLLYESLDYLYKGYELSEALRDTARISWYLVEISKNENYLGRLTHSMSVNLKSADFFKKNNDQYELAQIYISQGVTHTALGNYKTAQTYLSNAIEIFEHFNDTLQIGIAYLNMSELHLLSNDMENAQKFMEKAEQIFSTRSEKYLLRCSTLKSKILLEKNKLQQTITLLEQTANRQYAINDMHGCATTLLLLGKTYQRNSNYEKAISTFHHCINSARNENLTNFVRESYHGLANTYGAQQQYQQAYQCLNRYVNITDSLYNMQTISEANRLENQAVIRAKEREIASQNDLLLLNQEKLKHEKTKQRYLYLFIVISFSIIILAVREFHQKKKANRILTITNSEIEAQKKMLEQRTREITDSLRYARHIQKAILHSTLQPRDYFSDSFLIFQPKEMVSGDFYWFKRLDNQLLFAIADCTGHGTPGAFMSIIGTFGLNQIVNEFKETSPAKILNHLNNLFHKSFEQREGAEIFDGMDIGICNLDLQTNEIKFSGANIGLNIIRKSSAPAATSIVLHQTDEHIIYQTKYNKQSIGYFVSSTQYTTQAIQLLPNDCLYIFSDGYIDQFGGPKSKKFLHSELRSLLCRICQLPMAEQENVLMQTFNEWKGDCNQIDDVTFLGVRID